MRALLRAAPDKSPHQQDERCAHDASDEASSLTSVIPAKGLSKVGGDQSTDDAQGCGENEAFGFVRAARREELSNHSGNKADNNGPEMLSMVLVPPMIRGPTDYS